MLVGPAPRPSLRDLCPDHRRSIGHPRAAAGHGTCCSCARRNRPHLATHSRKAGLRCTELTVYPRHLATRCRNAVGNRPSPRQQRKVFLFERTAVRLGLGKLPRARIKLRIEELQGLPGFNLAARQIAIDEQLDDLLDDLTSKFRIIGIGKA